MDHTKQFNHLSLCAGYGGIDIGLSRALANTRTVCFVEIEAFNIENLVAKIEAGRLDPAPIYSNLKTFPFELFKGRVDIVSGGFPCQPFSAAGRRAGDDDPRHLWPFIVDGLRRMDRPPLVFFENVEGIISSRLNGDQWSDPEKTPVLLHVLRELERLGYKSTAGTFSAAEVGAPHQRKRVFILGIREDLNESGYDLISSQLREHESATNYPAHRGAKPKDHEPPRIVLGDADRKRLSLGVQGAGAVQKVRETSARHAIDSSNHRLESAPEPRFNNQSCEDARRGRRNNCTSARLQGGVKPSLGGDADGFADRVDYAESYQSYDNRIDELRSLGNGVVPDTAAKAFRVLFKELAGFP